jgi:MarR family 2-MHQ and catechol resistance regulon transcriptional repressor
MPARRPPASNASRKGSVRTWSQIRALRTLLRASAHLIEEHRSHLGARFDLLMTEFDMIAALGNTEGLNMGQLSGAMITTPGNVTRVAQAMEKRGLVERKRAPHSDREVLARLTPAGEAFFRDHFLEVAHWSSDLMDKALSSSEQKQLAELLGKLLTVSPDTKDEEDSRSTKTREP